MNRLIAGGIAVVVVLYLLFSSIYIVNVRQQAIVLRFGQITAVRTEPGLYFKLPTTFVDSVQWIEDRLLRYDIANMQLQVNDGATYVVDAFLTYRITDPIKFRERAQGDLDIVEQRIRTRFDAALRQVYGNRNFDAALSAERTTMMREAGDLIRPGMADLGIDVVDVRILRTDLTPDVSQQTFDRMSAERLAQAEAIRAGGQQAAQSLRAIADRQAVELMAAANKDSEILRGQGDAERNSVFAQAYSQDPEFFEFYRSLQAYRTALPTNGTTMVLSPDSEFFHYFSADSTNGQAPKPAAPNGIAPLASGTLSTPAPTDVLPPTNANDNAAAPIPAAPVVTLDQATPPITTDPSLSTTPSIVAPAPSSSEALPSASSEVAGTPAFSSAETTASSSAAP